MGGLAPEYGRSGGARMVQTRKKPVKVAHERSAGCRKRGIPFPTNSQLAGTELYDEGGVRANGTGNKDVGRRKCLSLLALSNPGRIWARYTLWDKSQEPSWLELSWKSV